MGNDTERHLLSAALDSLGRRPLNQAEDDVLVSLAHEVWYEHSNLESEVRLFLALDPDEFAVRRAGYLLEKMTRFACLTDDRAFDTLDVLSLLSERFPRKQQEFRPRGETRLRDLRDELAASWGLSEGLGMKVQTLLPYQTRHYAAGRNNAFK